MRIAFSGTGNSGKTTLVKNFLAVWPNYKQPEKTYRDLLKEGQLKHSKDTIPNEKKRAMMEDQFKVYYDKWEANK